MLKKSLLTLALSCGLMALPALAQSSTPSTPDQQTPSAAPSTPSDQAPSAAPSTPSDQQTPSAAPSTSAPDQQAPAAQSGSISDQSSASQSTTGAAADSSGMQSNIQTALQKDDQLSGQSVDVKVNGKNQVVLSGTVSSQAQKDHAEQVATQTAGSSYMVKNHIKVSGASSTPKQ